MRMLSTFAVTLLLLAAPPLHAQTSAAAPPREKPPLTAEELAPYTRYFDIVDHRLVGDGATFLAKEFAASQYVLLGEYHFSPLISGFTRAAIPMLHEAGFRTLGLEVGPESARILTELSQVPDQTVARLRAFNTAHHQATTVKETGRTFTSPAIPFFTNVEDAEFLAEARRKGWRLMGFDTEYATMYPVLIDRMFRQLGPARRAALQEAHALASAAVDSMMREAYGGSGKAPSQGMLNSPAVVRFLAEASRGHPRNAELAGLIRDKATNDGYYEAADYTRNNNDRIALMKQYLRRAFTAEKFDVAREKMVLKMGAVHTTRGFSVIYNYELGNLLSELALFHGNRSLHIRFNVRYETADSGARDNVTDRAQARYQPLLQMAKPDRWTVIDLRPLQDGVFMRDRWKLADEFIRQVFAGQDLYIIAPTERPATPNWEARGR